MLAPAPPMRRAELPKMVETAAAEEALTLNTAPIEVWCFRAWLCLSAATRSALPELPRATLAVFATISIPSGAAGAGRGGDIARLRPEPRSVAVGPRLTERAEPDLEAAPIPSSRSDDHSPPLLSACSVGDNDRC